MHIAATGVSDAWTDSQTARASRAHAGDHARSDPVIQQNEEASLHLPIGRGRRLFWL
jgi:hypothetical protein